MTLLTKLFILSKAIKLILEELLFNCSFDVMFSTYINYLLTWQNLPVHGFSNSVPVRKAHSGYKDTQDLGANFVAIQAMQMITKCG